MDRRTFLSNMARAAALAGASQMLPRGAAAVSPTTTVAAVGDCLISRKVSGLRDPEFLAVVELLRRADCTWANCEVPLLEPGVGYPAAKLGDPPVCCEPWGADELAWMGIDFVGLANNHTVDFGTEGLFATLENLRRVRIAHAGAGVDLETAAQPGYLDTAGGRIGQVNCTSAHLPWYAATAARPPVPGRPGLNPLGLSEKVVLPAEYVAELDQLSKQVFEQLGLGSFTEVVRQRLGAPWLGAPLVPGDQAELTTQLDAEDLRRVTAAIATARNHSRIVLFTIHVHRAGGKPEIPAPFLQTVAHAAIDAGADAMFAAGPHVLRGIEIYRGKPIFYSLSNFFYQFETMLLVPAEAFAERGLDPQSPDSAPYWEIFATREGPEFWQTIVPLVTFAGREVVAIDLYPVTLGIELPRHLRGTPMMARGEKATAILEHLAALSEPYGTAIRIDGGVGRVAPG